LIAALTGLFNALSAFWSLKKEKLVYDMLEESENKQLNLIKEIELNRDKKTEESTQRADFLFSRLQKEKIKYEKILSNL
jgi:hypothetical protein